MMTMNPSSSATTSRRIQRSAQRPHQRQYSDTSAIATGKWLQSTALLQQEEEQARSFLRVAEPSTPPAWSRSPSMRKEEVEYEEEDEEEGLSPGLLDLHSFDSELLPDIWKEPISGAVCSRCGTSASCPAYSVPHAPTELRSTIMQPSGVYDNPFTFAHNRRRSFDDADPNKLPNRAYQFVDNNLIKNFSADQEKSSPVAKIKVVVRKRPLNKKEISKKEGDIITISAQTNSLTVHESKLKVDLTEYVERHEFVFDAVLDERVSNDEVYRETMEPIVPIIFQRTKVTCFAYGQTGSGKTYTMQPLPLRASQDILRLMHYAYQNQGFQLFVSFFEIYGGKLYDLLNDRRKLCMREDGKQQVCIVGLREYKVSNVEAIRDLIEKGNATRSTGTTGANEESSRSHAILQLAIKRHADGNELKPLGVVGKLSFIDLAGSERGADTTENDKQTRIEGAEINKSLLALKECIRALDNDQVHIPFRGSKLTEVLRDSFIGNSRTVMISCVSPNSGSCEHTLNTLRYADRVKSLSKGNNPKKDPTATAIIKEPTMLPVTTTLPAGNNNVQIASGTNQSGWTKKVANEILLPSNAAHGFTGREQGRVVKEPLKDNKCRNFMTGEDFDLPRSYDLDKPSRRGKPDAYRVTSKDDKLMDTQMKWRDASDTDWNSMQLDDDLDTLLKEEEVLVVAHRRLVEETIDIVREEMKLLIEADQPGNQLDEYLSKLSVILSQKAAGIMNLQARLSNFQRLLNEHNVLQIPSGP